MERHLETAEAAWRWVLDEVRYDEGGPWIPLIPTDTEPAWDRDGMHSGIGGLVHVLAAVAATRPWTDEESALAAAVGERLRAAVPSATDVTYFDGLAGHIQSLVLLGEPGVDACVDRLLELAPDGWPDCTTRRSGPRRSCRVRSRRARRGVRGATSSRRTPPTGCWPSRRRRRPA